MHGRPVKKTLILVFVFLPEMGKSCVLICLVSSDLRTQLVIFSSVHPIPARSRDSRNPSRLFSAHSVGVKCGATAIQSGSNYLPCFFCAAIGSSTVQRLLETNLEPDISIIKGWFVQWVCYVLCRLSIYNTVCPT